MGFKGLITASNWVTANDDILGPLERASYTSGDFIDRHGYYGGIHEGEAAAWSIREDHEIGHRSALGFENAEFQKPISFTHPAFDLKINGMPSMISETTFTRPNRYRTEAPLFYAAYGALQGSDSIIHFALDSAEWQVKPRYFIQPWTLMSPTMMGQFPAAALIYRQGLIGEGEMMADVTLTLADAKALKGSPLSQQANLDSLRQADISGTSILSRDAAIDPRVHLIGRTQLNLTNQSKPQKIRDLAPFINEAEKTITSSTRELQLNYGRKLLRLDSPSAQGIVGNLRAANITDLPQVSIQSDLELGSIILVSLDGKTLKDSGKILLQVMSEEKPTGYKDEPIGNGRFKITQLGTDPWLFREPICTVQLKRNDIAKLKVTPLDLNGYPKGPAETSATITLKPDTAYYLIEN